MDAENFLIEFHDFLAPKLDVYEQALYLYVVRHTRLLERPSAVIGFKSACKRMGFGVGKFGRGISESTCYDKLKSLQSKGFIEILGSENAGTRVSPKLPSEIDGLIPRDRSDEVLDLESEDFFSTPSQRQRIVDREEQRCFYCLGTLNADNYVIEHVTSRPDGNSSYRNVVAACRRCNNRKGEMSAKDYLRTLLREGRPSDPEFDLRLVMLERLLNGELKPVDVLPI